MRPTQLIVRTCIIEYNYICTYVHHVVLFKYAAPYISLTFSHLLLSCSNSHVTVVYVQAHRKHIHIPINCLSSVICFKRNTCTCTCNTCMYVHVNVCSIAQKQKFLSFLQMCSTLPHPQQCPCLSMWRMWHVLVQSKHCYTAAIQMPPHLMTTPGMLGLSARKVMTHSLQPCMWQFILLHTTCNLILLFFYQLAVCIDYLYCSFIWV